MTTKEWFANGQRIPIKLKAVATGEGADAATTSRTVYISTHHLAPPSSTRSSSSSSQWITWLHGFPTCSHDYADLIGDLQQHFHLLLWDFLGYGDSDKDLDGNLSIHQLADIQVRSVVRNGYIDFIRHRPFHTHFETTGSSLATFWCNRHQHHLS